MAKKPPLTVVPEPPATGVEPPATGADPRASLREHGRTLWDHVVAEYQVDDSAGLAMLHQACAMLDQAEALRTEIERDGAVIRSRGVIRDHPAVKHELAARSFVCRTLARLGLNFEPVRTGQIGRPPTGGTGFRGWDAGR
jgi:hypothetical protein